VVFVEHFLLRYRCFGHFGFDRLTLTAPATSVAAPATAVAAAKLSAFATALSSKLKTRSCFLFFVGCSSPTWLSGTLAPQPILFYRGVKTCLGGDLLFPSSEPRQIQRRRRDTRAPAARVSREVALVGDSPVRCRTHARGGGAWWKARVFLVTFS
jgi:hypothetical protein